MNLTVPENIRKTLDWLELTEAEEMSLSFMYATSLMVKNYGGNGSILEAVRECWSDAAGVARGEMGNDWAEFLTTRLFTKDEFLLLVSDDSPYYGIALKGPRTPVERYCYVVHNMNTKLWAPRAMRELWWRQLELYEGDSVAAEISLEYFRPEVLP